MYASLLGFGLPSAGVLSVDPQQLPRPRLREAAHRLRGLLSAFSRAAGDVSDLEELTARGQLGEARPLVERLDTMARELIRQLDGLSIESRRRPANSKGQLKGR
jgi:hypothetical protein